MSNGMTTAPQLFLFSGSPAAALLSPQLPFARMAAMGTATYPPFLFFIRVFRRLCFRYPMAVGSIGRDLAGINPPLPPNNE